MKLQKKLERLLLDWYKRRKQRQSDLSLENCLRVVQATAAKTPYCFLITIGEQGWPSARLIEPICDFDDMVFYIGTNPTLRKITEINANPHVTLAFGNRTEQANLIVYGTATISIEPAIKRRYWKGSWRLFFPSGPNGTDYAVITVLADRIELMSFKRNVIAEPFGLRPVVLQRTVAGWQVQS
jgi:general stress protein 26